MNDYPPEWKSGAVQRALAKLVDYRCEHCGAQVDPVTNRTINKPRRDGEQHIIAIHHLDGDKANCNWTNLLYSCQSCHLEVQALWEPGEMLPAKWHGVPEWLALRGLAYTEHPQMRMFRGD